MGWFSDLCDSVSNTVSNVASGVSDFVSDAADTVADVATDAYEAVSEGVSSAARTVEVFGQGVTRGVASGVASLGDLAVNVGYNWTTRHAINAFKEDNLESYNPNLAGRAAEAVTWTEAENDYERAVMTAGQVTGEVAGFVAVTVATAGAGGAVMGGSIAAARGTAVGARVLSAGSRAVHAASKVPVLGKIGARTAAALSNASGSGAAMGAARIMNPLASKFALATEAGFGAWRYHDIYTTDQRAEEFANEILTESIADSADQTIQREEQVQNLNKSIQDELEGIISKFKSAQENPDILTDEERVQLIDRVEELKTGFELIKELRNDISEERRQEIMDKLNEITGNENISMSNDRTLSSVYSRDENTGVLTVEFAKAHTATVDTRDESAEMVARVQNAPVYQVAA